jgi:hypothetical protein
MALKDKEGQTLATVRGPEALPRELRMLTLCSSAGNGCQFRTPSWPTVSTYMPVEPSRLLIDHRRLCWSSGSRLVCCPYTETSRRD